MISDALFRVPKKNFDFSFKEIFDVFYDHAVEIFDFNFINIMKVKVVYHIILIEMLNNFKARLR